MGYVRPLQSIVVEGIVTTTSQRDVALAGHYDPAAVNIAPMGPVCDETMSWFVLRPFTTSTTFANFRDTGFGVFHVIDDVLLLAKAAISKVNAGEEAPVKLTDDGRGLILRSACRYYALEVVEIDDSDARATISTRVVEHATLRPFAGFNRARHAVVEAAILATRLMLTGAEPVLEAYEQLEVAVVKTGSPRERQAMDLLRDYVSRHKTPVEADSADWVRLDQAGSEVRI